MRFNFGIHSGARHDLPGKEGAAHFMEHLVSSNTLVSSEELKRFFKTNSGRRPNLGSTSFHSTDYGFHSSAEPKLLSESLHYFGHMLLQANLDNFVERERDVIIGEFNRRFPAKYQYQLARRMQLSVFPNTYYSRMARPLGTLESIKTLIQADLQQFYDTHYTPANMSVIAVGELTLEQTITFLEASPFGAKKTGRRSEVIEPITNPPYPTEQIELFNEGEYVRGKTVAQYESVAQLPGTVTSSELAIFSQMLGEVLFEEVRQKRAWAYSVGCGSVYSPDFRGFSIGSDGVNLEAVGQIEKVMSECIESLVGKTALFEIARAGVIASKRFDDPNVQSVAENALSDIFSHGRIKSLAEETQDAERVSMDDIRRLVTFLSPERRRTCIRLP
jgi:predicted Zn-dependent peptidase